ncbi:hypothetical protein SAJA_12535 [Salinisphaera japonica YTM-1]|uniref:Thioesterase domain-containing protein n=2 Tax=Salinisphaera TaxID=180541 RepID=A0A423PJH4_9GAMM|nr:hypothetical protein SAJA_12535 [Salinisphaera japonica YTM-1]
MHEPLLHSIDDVVDDFAWYIEHFADAGPRRLIYVGHSFGCYVAWAVQSAALRRAQLSSLEAELLVLACNTPLHLRENLLGETEFDKDSLQSSRHEWALSYLVRLNAIPAPILRDRRMLNIVVDAFLADITVADGLSFSCTELQISSPIISISARDDQATSEHERWREMTTGRTDHVVVSGGHFPAYDDLVPLWRQISHRL